MNINNNGNDNDDNDFDPDDFNFSDDDSDDAGFEKEKRDFRKFPLYLKATEILHTVKALCDSLEGDDSEMYSHSLRESSMIIPAKIAGAYGANNWLICMQNASLIRYHAEYLLTSTSGLKAMTKADKSYIKVMRTEMEEFREMFNQWVCTFETLEKDDYEDEWGLFIRK